MTSLFVSEAENELVSEERGGMALTYEGWGWAEIGLSCTRRSFRKLPSNNWKDVKRNVYFAT